jgi:TetR/AcrR family transcriptional regulator, cholesterol catabolism regulator
VDEITKILDSSQVLFRKYGIRSVTMNDIARSLGMSKKTLYIHIENKRDLVSKMMKRHIQEDQQMCLAIQKGAINALDELIKVSLYVQGQVKDINPALLFDLQKYHRPVWEMLDKFHRNDIAIMVEDNLRRGVAEGLYRKDLHVALISKIYVGLMPIVSDVELFPTDKFPTHILHKEFVKYHICGIVSEKGKTLLSNLLNSLDPGHEIH